MDPVTVAVRFALYLDLALLSGIPLFCVYALNREERASRLGACFVTAGGIASVLGIVLSAAGMVVMAKAMSGADSYAALDSHVFAMIVAGTDAGAAWAVRMAALLIFASVAGLAPRHSQLRFPLLALTGAIALSTLAWSGHGAMDDGIRRYIHLTSDIAHLLAAGAWVGALAAFAVLSRSAETQDGVMRLARTANGFAHIGTVIVATLLVTGVINYLLIVGPVMPALSPYAYGGLLLFKLMLFGVMLLLAAANRFHLGPRIAAAIRDDNHVMAVRTLQRSLFTETLAITLILALVAWFGMMSPDGR